MASLENLPDDIIRKRPCLIDSFYAKESYKLIQVAHSRSLNSV